jgi:enterobactin synthetase component D
MVCPLWPPGWRGSISHDATEAVALAAPDHVVDALGVDLEPLLDDEAFHSVIDVCLTPAERACQPSPPEQARREATLRFSAEEAYFKAVHPHVGRFVDFAEAEVNDIDMKAGTFRVLPAAGSQMPESRSPLFAMDGRFSMVGDRMLTRVARCTQRANLAGSRSTATGRGCSGIRWDKKKGLER